MEGVRKKIILSVVNQTPKEKYGIHFYVDVHSLVFHKQVAIHINYKG